MNGKTSMMPGATILPRLKSMFMILIKSNILFILNFLFERTKDPVEVTMKSPYIEVIFDGKNLKVTVLSSYSHPTFGVCGGIGACDKCGIHNHRILYAPSEVCFTMIPVLDCGSTCNPTTKILQEVGFTW